MEHIINVTIRDKIATAPKDALYVCGNSDFVVIFDFDGEWNQFDVKTARFIYNDNYTDVVFQGNQCCIPIISGTHSIKVGVFAGDLSTTTPAHIGAKKSILCDAGSPAAPSDDVYAQIMEMLQGSGGGGTSAVESVNGQTGEVVLTAESVGALTGGSCYYWDAGKNTNYLNGFTNDVIGQYVNNHASISIVTGSGKTATNGVTMYVPIVVFYGSIDRWNVPITAIDAEGNVFTSQIDLRYNTLSTPEQFINPAPNPNKLTITGAVEAEYDGSEAVKVEIPASGGCNESWELIGTAEVTEAVSAIELSEDLSGAPFELKKLVVYAPLGVKASQKGQLFFYLYQGDSVCMAFTSDNSAISDTVVKSVWAEFESFGQYWREFLATSTYDVTGVMSGLNGTRTSKSNGQPVNKVLVRPQYGTLTAGTFYIYGVRS